MNGKRHGFGSSWTISLQWLLAFWATALVFYFEAREGLVRWPWLFEPVTGGIFRDSGFPDPRFARPPSADSPFSPYLEIFRNSLGPYNIQWGNAPWRELLIALGVLFAYTALGWLFLSAFRIFMPRLAKACLALTIGCAAVGVGGEALAMAHLLTRPWVGAMWAFLFLAAGICWVWNFRTRSKPRAISADTRLTPVEQAQRARDWFRMVYLGPQSGGAWVLMTAYVLLFGLITFFVTLHAIGEPVVYWDSLILYVGYARGIYLEGGFPVKVVGQVGMGLGANYPHLYEVLTAQTAALAGYWSDSFAQLLPPVAVTAAMALVYYTALELSRNRLIAMAAALITRAVPYGLSYTQFASNYSIAILFTAAFIYLAVRLVRDGLPGYRNLMLLVAAGAVHINYLMWGLWPVAALAILMAHWRYRPLDRRNPEWQQSEPGTPLPVYPPEFMAEQYRPSLARLLKRRDFWTWTLLALALASPWYVRNTIVTGNPVYAFYSNVFPSKNVNPDVMRSAEQEWMLNGDGLANVGNTLPEKLLGSWLFFVTGNQHWKLAPFFMAFVMPGFVIWGLWWLARALPGRRRHSAEYLAGPDPAVFRSMAVVAALFLLLWFYAYVVADFYLYQIIIVLPLFGVFAAFLFMFCRGRGARMLLHVLVLVTAIAPGLAMSIMGFKLKKTGVYEGMGSPQFQVTALRKLFMDPKVYYRMEYGGDMDMIDHLNMLPDGTAVLTHENRHLLLDPKLEIVHLDDWEVQAGYGKSVEERVRILDESGVEYYLYVPNEDRHVANSWLGMEELIRDGFFKREYETPTADEGEGGGGKSDSIIPKGKNVLYQRTQKK